MDLSMVHPGRGSLFSSHLMESLFFSMSVYQPTRQAVLRELQGRFGEVWPLIDYGFEGDDTHTIFVARSSSGRIIVSCRGTVGFRDAVQNLKYLQSRLSFVKGAHWGFAERAEGVPIDYLCKLLAAGEEVIFTGHSLGGAVASLLCLRVLESTKGKYDEQVHCITFGCPLFASCRLAEWINSNYKDVYTHIVSRRDVVPKILPAISTLQKLVLADEDHLEGLFVLTKILEILPGFPVASFILGVERRIPSLFKFLFRCYMKLALPSGTTGSYAFAGHVVMLDTEATVVDRSLILASADEMNAWFSQLGFAFGAGFNVTMIEQHMLQSYYQGIVRNFSQVLVKGDFPPRRPSSLLDRAEECFPMKEASCQALSNEMVAAGGDQPSIVIRLIPQGATKTGVHSVDRADSKGAPPAMTIRETALNRVTDDPGRYRSGAGMQMSCPKHGQGVGSKDVHCSGGLKRARSESARIYRSYSSRSSSSRLERSKSNASVWRSRSERREGGLLERSKKQLAITCRACTHLQVHMNIKACCHQVTRKGVGLGRLLGTVGRVARHLRILDNLCYLTFVRILVGNLVG